MEELANLADALNVEVVGTVTQNLERVTPSHYVGTGKLRKLKRFMRKQMPIWSFLMMNYHHRKFVT